MILNFIYIICSLVDFFICKKKYIPVIFYHSINDNNSRLSVSPESFEKQIEYLKKKGFISIYASEVEKANNRNIVITFDDGFQDNLTYALPILKKHGFVSTIFIATKFIGKKSDYCSLEEDRYFQMLNKNEIKNLEDEGLEIASHFHSHSNLVNMNRDEIMEEYKKSLEILEKITDKNNSIVSYPRNKVNEKVLSVSGNIGIKKGFSGGNRLYNKKSDQILSIPRIEVDGKTSLVKFKLYLSPCFNRLKRMI